MSLSLCIAAALISATPPAVTARTRTFIMLSQRPYLEADAISGRLTERRFIPIIEDLSLDADTGVDGLTVALDAWIGIDAGERILAAPTVGDISEGWIKWAQPAFTLSAG